MNGQMMQQPLLISNLLVHAERHHGEQQVVSRRVEGDLHRQSYRQLAERSRRMANALAARGVKFGERVATLAWNGYRHMELYYAVSGSGAVLHTLNPRLHPDQVVWIADHAEDQVLFFDLTFLPLVEAIAGRVKTIKAFVAMTDRAHMPATSKVPNLLCYEELIDSRLARLQLAQLRREHRQLAVLHLGHHRQPEGRAVQPPLDRAAHLCRGAARQPELLGARRHPAGGADVPRQRLGPALCGVHGRRQAGLPRPAPGRQEPARAVRERRRHRLGRRADRLAGPADPCRGQRPEVQHHAPHRHRRLGLPAGDDARLPGALRRAGAARLGHDRDEPAGHGVHAQAQAPGPEPRRADGGAGQAGPRRLRRGHEDRRRGRPGTAARRQTKRRAAGARAVDHRQLLQGRGRRPAGRTAGSPPATWR